MNRRRLHENEPGSSVLLACLLLLLLGAPSIATSPARAGEREDPDASTSTGAPRMDNWLMRLHESLAARERLAAHGGGAARPKGASPTSIGATTLAAPNALVNSKIGDGFASAQVEPSIAMNLPFAVCAFNTDKFAVGGDGISAAFAMAGAPGPWTPAPLPPAAGPTSKWIADPVVTVNPKTSDWWFAGLFAPTGMPGTANGIAVVHGTIAPGPSGLALTWSPPVVVRSGFVSSILFDKEWLAADSSSGNLYLTYTTFGPGFASDSILFQRSTDGGTTWSAPITMIGATPALVQGSRVAVGPDGEVYVAWFHAAGPPDKMEIRKSVDHGLTFGPTTTASLIYSNYESGGPGSNLDYAPNFPSLSVDRSAGPHRGRVYLSCAATRDYVDMPLGTGPSMSEIPPSGSFMHATLFTPGMVLRGAMPAGDVDTWSFFGELGKTYVFNVDSIPSGFSALLLVHCPDTTETLVQGTIPTGIGSGKPNYAIFSPTESGAYFLKLIHESSAPAGYRIKTGTDATPPPPTSLDERDVVVMHSDDGTTWTAPTKVGMGMPGADQLMPEVGVSVEGYVCAMWLDNSSTTGPCMPSSNIMTSRSMDGGVTWIPAPFVTDVPTDWDEAPSDIVPNQGDYLSLYAGEQVGFAFADGRLGDPDIFSAGTFLFSGTSCGADSAVRVGSSHTRSWSISNANTFFFNAYACSLTCDRGWSNFPVAGSLTVGPSSVAPISLSYAIPDTAAVGVVHFTFKLAQSDGLPITSCTLADTIVAGSTTAVALEDLGPRLAIGRLWPNPGPGIAHLSFSLAAAAPASLEMFDVSGRRVWSREVGDLGAGAHEVALGRDLPTGIYAIRLHQSGRTVGSRMTILR